MRGKEAVMRLAKPKGKGLLAIVFSRLLFIVLLMLAQVVLYIAIIAWLSQYLPHYAVLLTVFTVGMVIYLFNNRMDSSAKLTWLAVIAVAPLFGAVLLAYTQSNLGHRATRKRVTELIAQTKDAVQQDEMVLERIKGDPYGTDDLWRYLNRSGDCPIFDHTEVTYFPLGDDKFAAVLEELEKAERFIFLEYFIIEEGYMWGRILDVLARKAKAGVDVRVLYDGKWRIIWKTKRNLRR